VTLTDPPATRLILERTPPGDLGDRYRITLRLDGELVADLEPGQTVEREISTGRHRLRASNTLLWTTKSFEAAPGEAIRFRVRNRTSLTTLILGLLGSAPLAVELERLPAQVAPPAHSPASTP